MGVGGEGVFRIVGNLVFLIKLVVFLGDVLMVLGVELVRGIGGCFLVGKSVVILVYWVVN